MIHVLSLSSLFGADADVLKEPNFQILFLANVIGPLGISIMSPVLESLTEPFGVSDASIGLMMSAFTAPAIVMILVAGWLSDCYGRKPILLVGLLVFGTGGAAIAFTTDFRVALALRFLQGVGFAATTPIIITCIGDLYEGTKEASAQGFRFTGSGITSMVFPLLAGVIVGTAWQYPFLLYAIAFPVAGLVYLRLEEPTVRVNDVTEPSKANRTLAGSTSLFEVLAHRRVQAIVVVRALPNMAYVGFLTYNSIVVVQFLDGTPAEAGMLAAVLSLSFAVAATQAGRLTAIFDSRLYLLIAANLALGAGFTIVLFVPKLLIALVGVVVSGFGFGIVLSMYRSIITDLAPASSRGSLVSVAEAFGRLTVTLTPILMGVVVTVVGPHLGFEAAVQTAVVGVSVFASGGSIVGLVVASKSATPQYDA